MQLLKNLPTIANLFSCAFLWTTSLGAAELMVIVKPALAVRDKPDLNGKILKKIPYGKVVTAQESTGTELTILGRVGKWRQIALPDDSASGWAFDGFLAAPNSQIYFEIVSGLAVQRSTKGPLKMDHSNFPALFEGGCLTRVSDAGCMSELMHDGSYIDRDLTADGMNNEHGKWYRSGKQIIIESTRVFSSPESSCGDDAAYGGESARKSCINQVKADNLKNCGKISGCKKTRRSILTMTKDNKFCIDDGRPFDME